MGKQTQTGPAQLESKLPTQYQQNGLDLMPLPLPRKKRGAAWEIKYSFREKIREGGLVTSSHLIKPQSPKQRMLRCPHTELNVCTLLYHSENNHKYATVFHKKIFKWGEPNVKNWRVVQNHLITANKYLWQSVCPKKASSF